MLEETKAVTIPKSYLCPLTKRGKKQEEAIRELTDNLEEKNQRINALETKEKQQAQAMKNLETVIANLHQKIIALEEEEKIPKNEAPQRKSKAQSEFFKLSPKVKKAKKVEATLNQAFEYAANEQKLDRVKELHQNHPELATSIRKKLCDDEWLARFLQPKGRKLPKGIECGRWKLTEHGIDGINIYKGRHDKFQCANIVDITDNQQQGEKKFELSA